MIRSLQLLIRNEISFIRRIMSVFRMTEVGRLGTQKSFRTELLARYLGYPDPAITLSPRLLHKLAQRFEQLTRTRKRVVP